MKRRKPKQQKSKTVMAGIKILGKRNPKTLEDVPEHELLSLVVSAKAATVLLEEYSDIQTLMDKFSARELQHLPNLGGGTIARLSALVEIFRRVQAKNK